MSGERLDNPVTGERIIFRETARETDGELLRLELFMSPGGFVALEHVHPNQEERFEILSGRLRFKVAGKERVVGKGEVLAIPPGVRHVFRNDGDREARLFVEFRPALRSQAVFEAVWGLAPLGRLNRRGLPRNPFQMAVIAADFRKEVRPASRMLRSLAALAPLIAAAGRLLGYRPAYERPQAPR